jgi:endonuclease G, mitochondrial
MINKYFRLVFLILLLSIFIISCRQYKHYSLEIPAFNKNENLLYHTNYCFVFVPEHKQSKWLAYNLKAEMTYGESSRSSSFYEDSLVLTGTATNLDYRGSGFDRGHLVPAGDMVFCDIAMTESFYYSNVSPQVPAFNRGIWKVLESAVRNYARNLTEIYVVTGPVLGDGLEYIGDSKVSVPEYFYKTILVYNDSIKQGIAFLMPNERGTKNSIYCYSMSISELEQILDINFYPNLSRRMSRKIETISDTVFWKMYE